jgi:hypothetical protein
MNTNETPQFPWVGIDPTEWLRTWQQAWRGAPNTLVQPILPGWSLNINSNNSSSPQTEADVLARHSYGRQIGRMADALEVLVVEKHGKEPADKRYADFLELKRDIDKVKEAGAASRIEQLKRDLDLLKSKNSPEYERLRDALRDALKS